MARIALIVAYNGCRYHGWQFQNEFLPTVQGELTKAISKVADTETKLIAAGRTDTGVHATKQVVHFDTSASRPSKAWVMGGNVHLPKDISIEWAAEVADDFDARRSALARRYVYMIQNSKVRSALMQDFLSHERRPLDADAMNVAAQSLLGENDFSSFRSANCQSRSPMRKLMSISVKRLGEMVIIDVVANAFLHHMVRNIVGSLLEVGAGQKPIIWIGELLYLADRSAAAKTAAPEGLSLVNVLYPEKYDVPPKAYLPHVYRILDIAGL